MTGFYGLSVSDQSRYMHQFAEEALKNWAGEFLQLQLIKYRENAVFSAVDSSGARVALRVHRPGYHSDEALKAELDWMQALAGAGVRVPNVRPSADGLNFVQVVCAPVPESRQVDMLTWLDGKQLGDIEDVSSRPEAEVVLIYRDIGRLAADLHVRSQRWEKPAGFARHSWDAEGLLGSEPFWGPFLALGSLTTDQRSLIDKAAGKARAELSAFGAGPDHYGLIHADMVPENIIVTPSGLTLIDFDDAGFGWYMFELATALFFWLDHPAYPRLVEALFEGYRESCDHGVTEDDLPLFLFLRSITYLGWVHTRSETETAREMTPFFIARACDLASRYLEKDESPAPTAAHDRA